MKSSNLFVVSVAATDALLRDSSGGIMYFPTRTDCVPYLYEGLRVESVIARQARLDGTNNRRPSLGAGFDEDRQ